MSSGIVRNPHADEPPRPLSALHIIDADALIRLGPMVRTLLEQLRPRAIDSRILTDAPQLARDVLGDEFALTSIPALHGWGAWSLLKQLRTQIVQPVGVQCLWTPHGWLTLSRLAQIQRVAQVVYVSTQHVATRFRRRAAKPHHYFVAATEALQLTLEARLRRPAEAIEVLPPVLTLPEWRGPAAAPRSRLPSIVWHGPLSDHAGLTVLVDAVQQLDRQGREVQVVLIGRGDSRQPLWRLLRERGVEHRVSVIDAPQFGELALQGADILVVPASEQETSLVPLIAMSRGVYVVASRDQSAEWFIDGETSLQFAPGSSKELAYQLTRILEGRQEVAGVLDTAREYVAENHDAVLYAPVFENILRAAQAHYATKTGAAS